jgi:hypothetical protein
MAKTRAAPSQFVSIPRLELQAAVVAVRVDSLLRRELDLPVEESFFWTDSKITLQYIHSENRRFKTYVANRVGEIRDASKPSHWKHVPGGINPADIASRGKPVGKFLKSERWFQAPKFLWEPPDSWPDEDVPKLPVDDLEIKEEKLIGAIAVVSPMDCLIHRYSSWTKLLRLTAILKKFCCYVRDKTSVTRENTVMDLEEA